MYIVFSLLYFVIPRVPESVPQGENLTDNSPVSSDTLAVDQDALDTANKSETYTLSWTLDPLGNPNLDFTEGFEEVVGANRRKDSIVVNSMLDNWKYEEGSFTRGVLEKLGRNFMSMSADDGNDFFGRLAENIPTMMFFLLPLFALLIKLFYFRQKPLYVETIVFSLHFHSFLFLLSSIILCLKFFGSSIGFLEAILALLVCVYLVISLRNVFNQNYWKTILKFLGLTFTYSILVIVTIVITVALTLYMY
jgi:hypothetical protein